MDANGGAFTPNQEVDELRWVPVEEATHVLSYVHDRDLLRRVLTGAPASAVYVVRHARAGVRSAWPGPDEERPLTRRGASRRAGSSTGSRVWTSGGSCRVPSCGASRPWSPSRRLVGSPSNRWRSSREGVTVTDLVRAIASLDERPTVVCSHGTEIESMIDRFHRDGATIEGARGIAKGSVWVLDRERGRVVSAQYLPAPSG